PFYPYQMAKDATGMLCILALLLLFAWLLPSPLGLPADPADSTFVPRPDWYFLWLFQLLHYFEGKWEVVGTFVIPTILFGALLLLPYYDRGYSRKIKDHVLGILCLLIGFSLIGGLTYVAIDETPKPQAWIPARGISVDRADRIKRPSEVAGVYVMQQNCFSC